ncbi:MAG: MBL fold metallo-hydrolase [Candidatus Thermoplasmatota archaeon]|nr:MBL fold metallo-hydrolase [Candidatus Thermoplasmatota archaeon]MBS3789414.1 MBL fold metallo-hydrolase [Candidatus Thermoplasmatota archaeon]
MKIKVVYDNEAKSPFQSDWGFSALIESDESILFDTGDDGKILLRNMKKMGIDTSSIDKVVLSHEHHDHTGGLYSILEKSMEVFVPKSFSKGFKKKVKERASLIEIIDRKKISERVLSLGEMGMDIIEQSIICKSDRGNILITGCAHPGLTDIIQKAEDHGDIEAVIGGFHGFDDFDVLENISLIVPCHCTEYKDKIKERYPDKTKDCFAGLEIKV